MKKSRFFRWLPATLMMAVIFAFSSVPSDEMPYFDWADLLVKKGGHMLGYGLLALTFVWGLTGINREGKGRKDFVCLIPFVAKKSLFLAWLLAALYAVTDELHQSFVPGRHASGADVVIDSLGAAIALWLWARCFIPDVREA
ncbi:MAG: hypothetical protein GXP40_06200 [Chloroflexi bacterium]|nr:hypothetical protein [Chloroflexota bacterium]